VRADWCPLVSYTNNLNRLRDALLDAETAWDQVTNLFDTGRRQASQAVAIGPFAPGRRFRNRPTPPPAPTAAPGGSAPTPGQASRSPFAPPTYPWQWSAGVLAGLAAFSLAVLTLQVRSLDRLR
jgi:hypothetical protein